MLQWWRWSSLLVPQESIRTSRKKNVYATAMLGTLFEYSDTQKSKAEHFAHFLQKKKRLFFEAFLMRLFAKNISMRTPHFCSNSKILSLQCKFSNFGAKKSHERTFWFPLCCCWLGENDFRFQMQHRLEAVHIVAQSIQPGFGVSNKERGLRPLCWV